MPGEVRVGQFMLKTPQVYSSELQVLHSCNNSPSRLVIPLPFQATFDEWQPWTTFRRSNIPEASL